VVNRVAATGVAATGLTGRRETLSP
jgi:hypothetical protein